MTVHTKLVPVMKYDEAVLDLLKHDLACYGWCAQRVYPDGRVDRINPLDMYTLYPPSNEPSNVLGESP